MTLKQVIRPFVTMAFCQQLTCILRLLEISVQKEVSVKEFSQQSCFHVFLYLSIFLDLNTMHIYSFIYITIEENGQPYPKEILYAFLKMKMFAFFKSQNPFQKWCVNLLGNASELLVIRHIHDWKWVKWLVFSALPLRFCRVLLSQCTRAQTVSIMRQLGQGICCIVWPYYFYQV